MKKTTYKKGELRETASQRSQQRSVLPLYVTLPNWVRAASIFTIIWASTSKGIRIMVILVILAFSLLVTLQTVSPSNLCSTAGLCCKHRDSECVAQKVFPNHTVDTSQLPCYCDHACIRLDDCCSDYKKFCAGKSLFLIIFDYKLPPPPKKKTG